MLALTFIFLAGTFFLTATNSAFRRIHRKDASRQLKGVGSGFFYRPFHHYFFPAYEYEGLFFAIICAQNITRFCYAITMLGFFSQTQMFEEAMAGNFLNLSTVWLLLSIVAFLFGAFVISDYLPRIFGARFPQTALRLCTPFSSLFMFLAFPFTYIFLRISQSLPKIVHFDNILEHVGRDEIINMLQRADLGSDIHERKLMESAVTFKERIAREIMVPRVDVFSLPAEMSIGESARVSEEEGYSRIPIYRNTVDNIVGVLMYKDVLSKFIEYEQKGNDPAILQAPISSIQKSILHIPETKKISSLLQEFRKKQVHLAIVVDEYGGTEGIVTIEDILEEIVGEISDEYDEEEELFYAQPDGSWIVDARMNILDVEEDLDVEIPQEGEYDTVGGFIFHSTGMIPPKGFVIHQNNFDMEILKSNDRCVEKVRIKPVPNKLNQNESTNAE